MSSGSGLSFSGLASGLDTQSIISQLMAVEKRPLQIIQTKKNTHDATVTALATLKGKISGLKSVAAALADRSKVNAKAASTDTPSGNPTVLTATASADAINGTYKVTVSQLATSTRMLSSNPLATVIDANATLGQAGFRYTSNPGTVTINGATVTTDGTTTLNSLIASINGSGAGVTAALIPDADGRANNRVQIVGSPGQSLQLGALSDTSNVLRLLNLSDAAVTGNTAASTNSGGAASAGALNTSITINGVTTAINQGNGAFDSAQNAQFIADAINNTTNSTVSAAAQANGTITLSQKTAGAALKVDVTTAGAGTGLAVATTQNGTDKVVSTTSLGVADVGASLSSSRLVTPVSGYDASGNAKFTINGVDIAYKASDSITSIVNRINASSAGVSAIYDTVQDRLRFTASKTGAQTMTVSDVQGNFLAATGIVGSQQILGQNAVFSIDSVNGGAALTSASNTISGYVPGVTLDLKSTSPDPVTVTVSQNPQTTIDAVNSFVGQYNATLKSIADLTAYDADKKTSAALTGDVAVAGMERQLRTIISSAAVGTNGKYNTLFSIGISFGAVGSAVGSTNAMSVDSAKLSAAIADNPQAVDAVLSAFGATLGAPTSTNNITGVSGTPKIHQDGTYYIKVTDATTGTVEARFESATGQKIWSQTGTLQAGQDSFAVIPGLKVTGAAVLTAGLEDSFTSTVSNRGIGVAFNDYLDGLLDPVTGYFKTREDAESKITADYNKRISDQQDRLDAKQASLQRKYTALETTMSKLQSQSSQLAAQIAKLG
jgi:flagellar hook-associated protein 2